MRRRLEFLIPIVLLAVLVQLLAPIAVFRVVAEAVSDPLSIASICSGTASSDDGQPANTQHNHGACCEFCGGGLIGAVAIQPPPLVFVSLQRLYQRVSWLEDATPMSTVRVGSNAQARAPPSFS
jgi:hypothetical protein